MQMLKYLPDKLTAKPEKLKVRYTTTKPIKPSTYTNYSDLNFRNPNSSPRKLTYKQAAQKMQAYIRGYLQRRRLAKLRYCTYIIQRAYRRYHSLKILMSKVIDTHVKGAPSRVQNLMRKFKYSIQFRRALERHNRS